MSVNRITLKKHGRSIIVDIDPETGEIATETFGYSGVSCIEDVSKLMKELATLTADSSKPERWKTEIAGGTGVKVGIER